MAWEWIYYLNKIIWCTVTILLKSQPKKYYGIPLKETWQRCFLSMQCDTRFCFFWIDVLFHPFVCLFFFKHNTARNQINQSLHIQPSKSLLQIAWGREEQSNELNASSTEWHLNVDPPSTTLAEIWSIFILERQNMPWWYWRLQVIACVLCGLLLQCLDAVHLLGFTPKNHCLWCGFC